MSIPDHRLTFDRTSANLRRARRLYALFIRKACEANESGDLFFACAERAQEVGLYSSKEIPKLVRYSLLRKFYRQHGEKYGDTFGWFRYLADFHWVLGPFVREAKKEAAA